MSVWTTRAIECPRCGRANDVQLADSIHVARVPEARTAILERTFHRTVCARCAHRIEVERQMLYIDVERGHWIQVIPRAALPRWPDFEAKLCEALEHGLDHGSPLVASLADGARRRLVIGYEQLREKLVVWAAGLNDAVVECIKLQAIAADPVLASPGSHLVVDEVTAHDDVVIEWQAIGTSRRVVLSRDTVRAADRDRDVLRARYPELFEGSFVHIARLLGPQYRRPQPR